MKVSMMLVSAVLAMVVGSGEFVVDPQGAGGSEVARCDDAACAAGCYLSCGESGACVAANGGAPVCVCRCE